MCECCEHWSTTLSHTETTARHCHTAHPPACPPDEVFLSCGVGTPRRGLFPLHYGVKLLNFSGPKTEPSEEPPPPLGAGWVGGSRPLVPITSCLSAVRWLSPTPETACQITMRAIRGMRRSCCGWLQALARRGVGGTGRALLGGELQHRPARRWYDVVMANYLDAVARVDFENKVRKMMPSNCYGTLCNYVSKCGWINRRHTLVDNPEGQLTGVSTGCGKVTR